MGKERRDRGGPANQGGGAWAPRRGHGGKGNHAARVYAGVRRGRRGLEQGNAILVVIARKGGREIERWQGNMNWPENLGELPAMFVGRRVGDAWIWNDALGETVCLYSAAPDVCGVEIKPWAYQRGATELVVRIVANPGANAADASAQGLGTQGQGTGMDARDHALAEMYGDMVSPPARAASSEDGSKGGGLGEQGAGAAQGMSGERAVTGRGHDAGQNANEPAGEPDGSATPSWTTRAGAAVDNEWGGRTPDLEHGKSGGSAGGQRGGDGHLLGLWNGPIDVAATVAIAVNAVLILLDADVNGLGERFLGKVVGGLAGKKLRKELASEAARVIDDLMPKVEKELAGDAGYQAMTRAERESALARARERLEHEYHARARAYFAEQAERSEGIAQKHAGEAGELAAHHHDTAAANARAYRELEQAAAQNGGLDIDDHIDATWARQGRTGEGVEAESMQTTSARGAGVTRHGLTERHHVLPQELKGWLQERGFPGNDIDAYCVQLDIPDHQALHGGGNPHLGRTWKDEWNHKVKKKLYEADEAKQLGEGRKLNRDEVLAIINMLMDGSPILRGRPFIHYRAKQ